jgi:hypothetical protein
MMTLNWPKPFMRSPGRQEGYLLHFAGAKQSATRTTRIEKHAPRIFKGLGLVNRRRPSRAGRFAAFIAARDGQLDLWLTQIGSNVFRNLTAGNFQQLRNPEIRSVAFSPDGSRVAFWTRQGDGSRSLDINIMAVPTAGGAVQVYLPETAEFDWSPDGSRVVFHTTAPGDPLYVRSATEANAHPIYVALERRAHRACRRIRQNDPTFIINAVLSSATVCCRSGYHLFWRQCPDLNRRWRPLRTYMPSPGGNPCAN